MRGRPPKKGPEESSEEMERVTFRATQALLDAVDLQVGQKRYANRSEAIRDALRQQFATSPGTGRAATDGGRDDDDQYYVVDEARTAVVAGPFQDKDDAVEEATNRDPERLAVATEGALELIEMTSPTTFRWENEDVDVVTDGGRDVTLTPGEEAMYCPDCEDWLPCECDGLPSNPEIRIYQPDVVTDGGVNVAVQPASSRAGTETRRTSVSTDDRLQCPECNGAIRKQGVESVCEDCGLVNDVDAIDHGPEWRPFDQDSRRRVSKGDDVRRHDHGLGSVIGFEESPSRLSRQRRLNKSAKFRTKKERNLAQGLKLVRGTVARIEAGDSVSERACQVFRDAHSRGFAMGRSLDQLAAVAVLISVRESGFPISASDLAPHTRADENCIVDLYQTVVSETGADVELLSPSHFVRRVCSELDLEAEPERIARELTRLAEAAHLHNGRNPRGVAAAAAYVATRNAESRVTQHEAAEAAGVCVVTLRNRYEEIEAAGLVADLEVDRDV